jgi:transposase-like protein
MTKTRRKFTAKQKATIVRRHLKDKEPISSIAEELSIQYAGDSHDLCGLE